MLNPILSPLSPLTCIELMEKYGSDALVTALALKQELRMGMSLYLVNNES